MVDSGRGDDGSANDTRTDGGQHEEPVDYLDAEVNLLKPSTPFMRDHLRVVWAGFVAWLLITWGPIALTAVAPGAMTTQIPFLEFPLHYFLVGFAAPTGSLLLAYAYALKRDQLDEKYGIDPSMTGDAVSDESPSTGEDDAVAADGGVEQ